MKMIFDVESKPKFGQLVVFAIQQMLAIMAATIAVPMIVGNGMSTAAAMFGAGIGTLVYQLFTKFKSPVFLGSSFAFIGSMFAAFGGAASASAGYAGLIIGAIFAGLVYVIIAAVVKFVGVNWINKLMPPVVIGPTVALIGLSLAVNAVNDLTVGKVVDEANVSLCSPYVALICGIITLLAIFVFSVYGKKMIKLIPFIIGILAGYVVAAIFTVCGIPVIDFSVFQNMQIVAVPQFTFLEAIKGVKDIDGAYIATVAVAYVPVAFVVFAEHLADHKNIVGIKEANANLSMMANTIALCGDKIDIYSGNDDEVVPCLSLGGVGVISVLSNIAPKAVHDMCYHYFNGDVAAARDLQIKYYHVISALFSDVNPIPVKEAMNMMGLDVGECRLPLVRMSNDAQVKLRAELAKVNLI